MRQILARWVRRPPTLEWRRGSSEIEPDPTVGGIDIIVPVHGAAVELGRCLTALRRHTDLELHHLIVIEDAGNDPEVERVLAGLEADAGICCEVLRNPVRRGFVGSVNRGMARSDRDVVLLNSDTEVTSGWVEKMQRAAYMDPATATVTPFSNDATICSLPVPLEHNELPTGHDVDSFARLVEACAGPEYPRIPTGVGMCLYIKRKVLDQIGLFDELRFGLGYGEENEFCLRAIKAGYVHVLDDATFIYHAGHRSFGSSRGWRADAAHRVLRRCHPEYLPTVARFLAEDPLKPVRQRVVKALQPAQNLGRAKSSLRRVLHVVHGWPPWGQAGTELYARWLAVWQARRREVAAYARIADPASPLGESRELFDEGVRVRLVVNNFHQRNPLTRNSLHSSLLERDFAKLLAEFQPDLVHIHHLLGHSVSLLAVAARCRVPILYQAQDWWPACARVNFTHRDQATCSGPGIGKCAECLPLTGIWPRPWWNRLLYLYRGWWMQRLLRRPSAFVMGSRFIEQTYRDLGLLGPTAFVSVLGYGVPLAGSTSQEPRPKGVRHRLRFGYVGSILPHKGVHLLVEAFQGLDPERVVLEVWGDTTASRGYTESLQRLADPAVVQLRGTFAESEKRRVLEGLDALVMPSIGYESFGLVAREAMACGTPVLAARASALAEMFEDGTCGAFFAPGETDDLRRLVVKILEDPAILSGWQRNLPRVKSLEEHGEEMEELYSELQARHRGGLRWRQGSS